MRTISPHLRLGTLLTVSNVWLFEPEPGVRFLVDTGHRAERPVLALELRRAGLTRGQVSGVILTHRHSDHAGNAAWLRETLGCPVICHDDDADILAGRRPAAKLARGIGPLWAQVLCRFEDRLPARVVVDETFGHGRWRTDFQVVHVPGHTDGSHLLYHEPTGVLFSGDAILAGPPPLRVIERLKLAEAAFSDDMERCHQGVRTFLRDLPRVSTLCSGHGPAVTKQTSAKLRALLRS
jgi:glyoxylase-like metal-dependent hydrolase (beta-lactamase superfamily II)